MKLCMIVSLELLLVPLISYFLVLFFFFFQAEDGIRDWSVTGVQTCALPISLPQREIGSIKSKALPHREMGSIKSGGAAATKTGQYKKWGAAATRN